MNPRQILLSTFAVLIVATAPASIAQEHPTVERGFEPGKVYQFGDLDSVSIFNGGLTLSLPIGGRYPAGGSLAWGLTLTYSSKFWDFEEYFNDGNPYTLSLPARHQQGGLGWTLSLGRLLSPNDEANETGRWQYLSPDGGRHGLYSSLHPFETQVEGVYYTRSGTYLRMIDSGPASEKTLEFPDGTLHRFSYLGALRRIEDRFGNFLRIRYDSNALWTLIDNQGREATIDFVSKMQDGQDVMLVDKITLPAFGGTSAVYDFEHSVQQVPPAEIDPRRGMTFLSVQQLTRLSLPDGTDFEMEYNFDGELAALILPTLGRVEYGYGVYQFPSEACDDDPRSHWTTQSRGVKRRTLASAEGTDLGEWTYHQSLLATAGETHTICTGDAYDPPDLSTTVVRNPLGHETRHYFSVWPMIQKASPSGFLVDEYGMPIDRSHPDETEARFRSSEVFECAAGTCDLKRSTYVDYEHEVCSGDIRAPHPCEESNRRLRSQRTVYEVDLDGQGKARHADVVHSDFDGLGHYRTTRASGSFGATRTTYRAFNPGYDLREAAGDGFGKAFPTWPKSSPWILETYALDTVSEGTATETRELCFDPATGFLQRTRAWAGNARSEHDVVTRRVADGSGNVVTEESYGGDVQSIATGALCDLSLTEPVYRTDRTYAYGSLATERSSNADGTSLGFLTRDATIDFSTGRVAAARDPAGLETTFAYDPLGRLDLVVPAEGHGAVTDYVYTPAGDTRARVQVRRQSDAAASLIYAQEDYLFDDLGRLSREGRWMPGSGWAYRTTDYDALGQQAKVSTWYDPNVTLSAERTATEYSNYDAFGRPRKITPPDGSGHDIHMVYTGDRVVRRTVSIASAAGPGGGVQEASVTASIERYDHHGRLLEVVEPSGDAGASVTTSYRYDVGNRLVRVSSDASGTVAARRSFSYDGRGFLLSESHPEKVGSVTYGSYDPRGHARKKIDGGIELAFEYDRAGRLTRVKEPGEDGRTLKVFSYATANDGANLRQGKLETATRYNFFTAQASEAVGLLHDGFECGDLSAWSAAEGAGSSGGGAVGVPSCGEATPKAVRVAETYVYAGSGGRVSRRKTDLRIDTATHAELYDFAQAWTYDPLGSPESVTYPECTFAACDQGASGASRVVTNSYTRGLLTGVGGYAGTIEYQPNGLPLRIYHSNGLRDVQEADPNGLARPRSLRVQDDNATYWSSGTYQYDGAGNVKKIGGGYYLYDGVSRLVEASVSTAIDGSDLGTRQTYGYDAFGNLHRIGVYQARNIPVDSTTNRLSGAVTYDDAGNLTGWNGNLYEYDRLQMMTRKTSSTQDWFYAYTADDERIMMHPLHENDARLFTLRDLGGQVLRQYRSTGSTWTLDEDYIYRGSRLLAAETPAGVRHFHLDHLGTPRLVTNASGQTVAHHVYLPFGEELSNPFQDEERMKFTGHERDLGDPSSTADDLDYMHARFCSPLTGRFLGLDPVMGEKLRPQSWNRFAYARNNPLKWTDPTGEVVSLGQLSLENRELLLEDLATFTGNRYGVDESLNLTLEEVGTNSSPTATELLSGAISSGNVYGVTEVNSSSAVLGRAFLDTNEIGLDFDDFSNINYGDVPAAALGPAAVFAHELVHVHLGLRDPGIQDAESTVGPVVDYVNAIRSERNLPVRGPAYSGSLGLKGRVKFNFQGLNPQKPERIHYVRVENHE